MSWVDDALCAEIGGELWMPDSARQTVQIEEAKRICRTCPVIVQCLEHALANDETGVWGGTWDSEREAMKRAAKSGAA